MSSVMKMKSRQSGPSFHSEAATSPRRRRRRQGPQPSERAALAVISVVVAVVSLLASAHPTGVTGLDALYRVLIGVSLVLAGSRARRWALIVGSAIFGGVTLVGDAASLHRASARWRVDTAEGAGDATDAATALVNATTNVGIAGGALLGSRLLGAIDVPDLGLVGAGLVAASLVLYATRRRRAV